MQLIYIIYTIYIYVICICIILYNAYKHFQGYSGRFCDLFENPDTNSWRWLATDVEGMMPRAAHTAVYLPDDDSLYVFGGYDLNRAISSLEV